ncbi:HAMP domain-containing sensor histidine kinase [uncultured Ilyobacter sp.]|uniref:sensor histidine kinase n=1 Tax=uncultured Ilyobacter sp. TaxID=544433 RepID=UPI0029F4D583|nr:HAMP domain-containing sensor histidine kinase [uncultured Ilyobacter sp.]
MKTFSKELWKKFMILIFIFITGYGIFIYSIWGYFVKQSKKDIVITENFIINELKEPEHQNIEEFVNLALRESPKINELYIILVHNNVEYKEEGTPDIQIIESADRMQEIGHEDFFLSTKRIEGLNDEEIVLTIIRGMSREKYFMKKILKISAGIIFVFCGAAVFISKSFYRKVVPQLKKLEEATNKINLTSFEADIEKSSFFVEFSKILSSYEKMLNRLENQASVQIDFINNASHELKTPIFIIGSYVDLLKRWGGKDRKISKEAIESIYGEVKNMEILIEKLLFLAKQDKIDIVKEEIEIGELIEEIIKEMEIIYPNQSINYSETSFHVNSDRALLKHLIKNIVDNAIVYGDGKAVDIFLCCESNVTIKVQDRGAGISKEDQSRIFDKFYRAEQSRNRNLGGHGLGLSIVKSIADILKLDISFTSEIGAGTTVEITLPVN